MQLVLCIMALYYQPISINWWLWLPLFLAPDLSMIGYLISARVGATCYNAVHHKATAGILIMAGVAGHFPVLLFTGLLLWAHSSFDRIMGYGLKFPDSFQHTHLGIIGKKTSNVKTGVVPAAH